MGWRQRWIRGGKPDHLCKENLSGAAVIAENPDVFDPKKYNAAGRKEVKKYVMQKIMVVGSNGKAK